MRAEVAASGAPARWLVAILVCGFVALIEHANLARS
jgi:hypothetical protein